MMFASQREAKKFLAGKITAQAVFEGSPLSDVEQRLLMFSEQDPESLDGIPEDVLGGEDPEYEAKITRLMAAAYRRDRETNPADLDSYQAAMRALKGTDHYILIMAEPGLAQVNRGRDLLKFAAIVLLVTIAIFAFAFWRARS